MSRVLVISDPHYPFQHQDIHSFLSWVQKTYKTTEVVCIGDLIDNHAMSKWDHDPDGDAPGPETSKSIKALQPLYKLFPKMKVCYGNHDLRAYKAAFANGISKLYFKSLREVLEAPQGWQWSDTWEIDGVRYEHGDAATGQDAARTLPMKNMQSTVFGHLHKRAGVSYIANPKLLFWGMNVGCLINKKAYAFEYGKLMTEKPIIGCGVVIDRLPIFIPMELDSEGRWKKR